MSARARRSTWLTAVTAVVVALVVLFAVVALNAVAAGDGVEARQLERQLRDEQRRYDHLVGEVAELKDLRRIEQLAREELGMEPADDIRHLPLPSWSETGEER